MGSANDVKEASRQRLIDYLLEWGYSVYAAESTESLRKAALENFLLEGY